MCIISDKIKFCTCTNDLADLKHYWILYRRTKSKNEYIVGEPMMPTSMRDQNFEMNKSTLLERLNEEDAFDFQMKFKEKDRLDVIINNRLNSDLSTFSYTFEYKQGTWRFIDTDPFDIVNFFKEVGGGKMSSVLKK
jgi:hypothetical protein